MKYDVEFIVNTIIECSNELKHRQNRVVIINCKINSFHNKSYRENRVKRTSQRDR